VVKQLLVMRIERLIANASAKQAGSSAPAEATSAPAAGVAIRLALVRPEGGATGTPAAIAFQTVCSLSLQLRVGEHHGWRPVPNAGLVARIELKE
jgi:hypothetical protein